MADDRALRAARHRAACAGVTFVAITGSCGKSTTKHLAEALLGDRLAGIASPGSENCGAPLVDNVLRTSPAHDYCLQEMGAWGPGTLDTGLELVRPTIGVVLNVRRDHFGAFGGLDATAAEKVKVVAGLPPSGTAILNADDPRVAAMRAATGARVLAFGRSHAADLRACEVTARWPDRLAFELAYGGTRRAVRTRLVGEAGLGSALAALAIALAMGVRLDDALERLAEVEPLPRRMSVVELPDGVTFVRDDFKAASDSIPETFAFMASARAARKVAVVGRISDHPGRSRPAYEACVRAAIEVVDELMFAGERPHSLWSSGPRPRDDRPRRARVSVLPTVRDAARDLGPRLREGDLVLLKASGRADHVERILHARTGEVACWLADCGRVTACEECELLRPARPPAPEDEPVRATAG
jgi:UDP-N-acetylmuramoyl-tripeptide--D-alanyl-D-alanine ligase